MERFNRSNESGTSAALLEELTRLLPQAGGPDAGRVRPEAYLGADLGLSSVSLARLAGLLRKRFGRPLPFHQLFSTPQGDLLQDVRVSDLAAFLGKHLRAEEP